MIARHPETTFICAHLANDGEDLATVAAWLDDYPNMYVDIDARISELGRQPYAARRFLIKYQDRVLFGTDTTPNREAYRMYFRFLETDDEYFDPAGGHHRQGFWMIYGVFLPDDVLAKLYNGNARKILFGLPAGGRGRRLTTETELQESMTMRPGPLSAEQLARYERQGYLLVDAMFDAEEIGLLLRSAKEDRALDAHSYGKDDGEGGRVRLSLWNHPGRGHLRHVRAVPADRRLLRADSRRRGLPLPFQDDHEGRQGRRRLDLAPGLRLLVPERRPLPRPGQRLHRGRSLARGRTAACR